MHDGLQDTMHKKDKKKTLNSAKHVKDFQWRAQQDSNLWPFDS